MAPVTGKHGKTMRETDQKGFTLIEMIAALAIMITLVAIAVPMAIKFMEVQETRTARMEMSRIFNDILYGDPKNGTFGFVGDIGHYPGKGELKELIANPGYKPSHTCTGGVKYGWNGPYSPDGENLLRDPWGEYYLYKYDEYSAAIIISKGPNKKYSDSDDLFYPVEKDEIPVYGSVLVEVHDDRSSHKPATQTLLFYYAVNGEESDDKVECICKPPGYTCSHLFDKKYVHHGLHLIQLYDDKGQLMTSFVATVIHGQQTKVTLTLR